MPTVPPSIQLWIEQQASTLSLAETAVVVAALLGVLVLWWIAAKRTRAKPRVILYTSNGCEFSKQEIEYLRARSIPFEERNLNRNRDWLTPMLTASNGFAGTPVTHIIWPNGRGQVVKGFTKKELRAALAGNDRSTTIRNAGQRLPATSIIQLIPSIRPTRQPPPIPTQKEGDVPL